MYSINNKKNVCFKAKRDCVSLHVRVGMDNFNFSPLLSQTTIYSRTFMYFHHSCQQMLCGNTKVVTLTMLSWIVHVYSVIVWRKQVLTSYPVDFIVFLLLNKYLINNNSVVFESGWMRALYSCRFDYSADFIIIFIILSKCILCCLWDTVVWCHT